MNNNRKKNMTHGIRKMFQSTDVEINHLILTRK